MLERVRRRLRGAGETAPPPLDPAAAIARVRALLAEGRPDAAQARAERLRRRDPELGRLASGIVAYRRGYPALAHAELDGLPRPLWTEHAPAEHPRAGLAVAPAATLAELRAVAADGAARLSPEGWHELVGIAFGHGDQELARALFARLDEVTGPDSPVAERRDALRPWIAADPGSPTAPAPPGARRTVAIMDYGHPGLERASANVGDHVQSIAALGHLVRHRGVRLHGDPELIGLLGTLGERVRPACRLDDVDADVQVMTVHRDASAYQAIPEDAWVLCFGWYMHALFELRHGFPLHRNLRPVFVSFHCNKRSLLTPAAIEYLRRYGPVGCRDWTTVYLLLSCGVPAFFTGCVTTTIDVVFPPAPPAPAGAPPAYVDVPEDDRPDDAVTYRHSSGAVRRRPFAGNVRRALDLLETYRTRHSRVITSRLHCYLPVRSLGVPAEFRPANRADIRFDGLIDIGDDAFAAIRAGLLERLAGVHAAILSGATEAEVYAHWRAACAADVARAERRRAQPPAIAPVPDPELAARVRAAVAATEPPAAAPVAGAIDCAVVLAKGEGRALAVLVASLLEHASRPLHLWVLARPGTGAVRDQLRERFPDLPVSWVPLRGLAPVARLALPELAPAAGRVVRLPLPAVATADVAELAALDLGGHAFAAATRPGRNVSGFGVVHAAAARLGDRADAAAELRRITHARHAFDFDAFAGDVLVVDREPMRAQAAEALALAGAFGLRELEALHCVTGPARAELPARWAQVPTRVPPLGPGLVHWADARPGGSRPVPQRELWARHARAFSPRRASA